MGRRKSMCKVTEANCFRAVSNFTEFELFIPNKLKSCIFLFCCYLFNLQGRYFSLVWDCCAFRKLLNYKKLRDDGTAADFTVNWKYYIYPSILKSYKLKRKIDIYRLRKSWAVIINVLINDNEIKCVWEVQSRERKSDKAIRYSKDW